jgi:hypothetical protein
MTYLESLGHDRYVLGRSGIQIVGDATEISSARISDRAPCSTDSVTVVAEQLTCPEDLPGALQARAETGRL